MKILALIALFTAVGCASAQKDTMMAELVLSQGVSLAYRTIDGIDKIKTDQIKTEIATNPSKAKSDYAAYKPKIEKARASINTAEDILEDAENLRVAATLAKTDWKNYTAYLPALVAAAASVQQTIADIRGLIK